MIGSTSTFTQPANTFSSTKSQQDANTQAYNAAVVQATAALSCSNPPTPPPTYTYYNTQQVAACPSDPSPSTPVTYPAHGDQVTVPAAYTPDGGNTYPFSSTTSQAAANALALTAATGNLTCGGAAAGLSGLYWAIPWNGGQATPDPADTVTTMGGTAGATYNVTLRFRGIVEVKPFSALWPTDFPILFTPTGGIPTVAGQQGNAYVYIGNVLSGGVIDPASGYNEYALVIGSPAQFIILNVWSSSLASVQSPIGVNVVDFTIVLQIAAGSSVTLTARSIDQQEFPNCALVNGAQTTPASGNCTPFVITPGPSDPPINPAIVQPYQGQFLQMDVVSITQM
jgi:hypothetical protein